MPLFLWFDHFWYLWAEILTIFSLRFYKILDTKISFWNKLIFRHIKSSLLAWIVFISHYQCFLNYWEALVVQMHSKVISFVVRNYEIDQKVAQDQNCPTFRAFLPNWILILNKKLVNMIEKKILFWCWQTCESKRRGCIDFL